MFIEFLLGGRQHDGVGKRFLSLNASFTTHWQFLGSDLSTLSLSFPIHKKGITILTSEASCEDMEYIDICEVPSRMPRRGVNVSLGSQV